MFLLAEQESEQELEAASDSDTKMAVYDRVIKDCVDVLQVVREELKSDEVRLMQLTLRLLARCDLVRMIMLDMMVFFRFSGRSREVRRWRADCPLRSSCILTCSTLS